MFTGLVTAVGTIAEITPHDGGYDLRVTAPYDDLADGESIAVNGACLTVARRGEGWFAVHAVTTTIGRTTFSERRAGDRVNLERALRVGDRMGGHWVQGHVDGVGTVRAVATRDDATLVDIEVPDPVAAVSIPLGSITVDGVSMTVNAIPRSGVVQLAIVPFTLQHTTLGGLAPGGGVHRVGDTEGTHVRGRAAGWRQGGDGRA